MIILQSKLEAKCAQLGSVNSSMQFNFTVCYSQAHANVPLHRCISDESTDFGLDVQRSIMAEAAARGGCIADWD